MKRLRFFYAYLLVWTCLAHSEGAGPEDPVPSATAPPAASVTPPDPKAESALVQVQFLLIELRGDTQRALKEAGFINGRSMSHLRDSGELHEVGPSILESLKQHADSLDVLSRPEISTVMGQTSTIFISAAPTPIPYLVRTGEKTFEMREATPGSPLGIKIQFTVQPLPADLDQLSVSPMKISTTTIDGREPIAYVDLDIGKPIVSTRTLETSITLVNGAELSGVVLPAPAGRQPVLFVRAQRVREPRPGEILPHPGARIPIQSKAPKKQP
jgi:hypothetical protein